MTVERWCSMSEICKHFNTTYYGVKLSIKYDHMPATKIGRLWRFKMSEVDEWLNTPEGQNSVIIQQLKRRVTEEQINMSYQKHNVEQKGKTNVQEQTISYKPLFKMLIDRGIKKKELSEIAGVSIATITKMNKDGNHVNSDVLVRICKALKCNFSDIVDIIPIEEIPKQEAEKTEKIVNEDSIITSEPKRKEIIRSLTIEEYELSDEDREIVHFIFTQLNHYFENPPQFMISQALLSLGENKTSISVDEAKELIPIDRYYSLVFNEVFEKWGSKAWDFDKKNIPYDLIKTGFFEST